MSPRLVVAGEEELLSSLHAQCFTEVWSASSIAGLLAGPGTFALLSACQSGFIMIRAAAGESEVLTLAVTPAARRRGVATVLITTAATYASEAGASDMFLEVNCTNLPALALYKRLGFAEVGRRKWYYQDPSGERHDALVLRRGIPLRRVGNPMQLG